MNEISRAVIQSLASEPQLDDNPPVKDRHYVVPLTDEEYKSVKLEALVSDLHVKKWIAEAVREKLRRENEDSGDRV